MKRKLLLILTIFTLCLTLPMTAFAETGTAVTSTIPDTRLQPRLVDDADLLTDSEEQRVEAYLDQISESLQFDVAVVTKDSIGSKTPMEYADDYYDYNGYGYGANRDGTLLLISMEDRDYWITTTGYGITALTDYGIQYLGEEIVSDLSDGEYAHAFLTFGEEVEDLVKMARQGNIYDVGSKKPFNFVFYIVIAAIAGIVLGIITMFIIRSATMKSVRKQVGAAQYEKTGSLNLTDNRDVFLYNNVTRHYNPPKDSDSGGGGSSTHTSSSGSRHGGGGGKF